MNFVNYSQASHWLQDSNGISLQQNLFVQHSFWQNLHFKYNPSYRQEEISKITKFLTQPKVLSQVTPQYKNLCDRLIRKYEHESGSIKRIIQCFDRTLVQVGVRAN